MGHSLARGLNRIVGILLPERRLFLRCGSCTRYARLTPLRQLGLAAAVAGVCTWAGYAAYDAVSLRAAEAVAARAQETRAVALDRRLAALEAERARLVAERDAAEARADGATDLLRRAQARLLDATGALSAARNEVAGLRDRLGALSAARRKAEESAAAAVSALAEAQKHHARARAEGLAEEEAMAAVNTAITRVIEQRDRAAREAETLDARVARLEAELSAWQARRDRVFDRLETAARVSLDGLEGLFDDADLDVDRILEEARRGFSGTGGPFMPVDAAAADAAPDMRLAALMSDLERVNLMRIAAARLPFGHPASGARLTSDYGRRRDPFRGAWSMHEGVDYAAPLGTPIRATAEGVVERVGWMGGYGRVVIIRHAFGFETRYAHLRRSFVKVGQRVGRGERIAEMGSSGRSTGSHIHYEVRLNDRPVDPGKFIKAARDVL